VKDWAKYGLLSGQTNIYFNGTFVGKTYINASQTTNELPISMGIDKQITVKRERLEDFCESKLIGSNKKETIGIETTVKNTKSKTVIVIVKEHIPISSNSDIEVNLLEKSNAKYNAKTGMLSWKLELEPGASQAVIFKYEVKYPKDRKVNL
jgi:uncharacterized protein (TIGR02231 family)